MKLPELRTILKENNLRGYSHYNKPELTRLLVSKGLIEKPKEKSPKPIKDKEYLKGIRKKPKKVKVTDLESGEETEYPSIYKCAQAFNLNPGLIVYHAKTTMKIDRGKYEINVVD